MKPKMTQKALAEILGVSRPTVTQMLTGRTRHSVHPDKAKRYFRKTGVSLLAWLTYTPTQLRKEIERTMGVKINIGRGRLQKQSKEWRKQ